jgi:hypothetical protein
VTLHRFLAPLLLFLTATGPLVLADQEYDELMTSFDDAQRAWISACVKLREAATETQPVDESKLPPHPAGEFLGKFKAYAERHAGKPEALPALGMVIQLAGPAACQGEPNPDADWAVERLARDHAQQEGLADTLGGLQYAASVVGPGTMIAFYEKVIEKNPSADAKARAKFNLAFTLYSSNSADQPQEKRDADVRRATELFRSIVKDAPSTASAKSAEGYLFEIDHLQVGMVAPDFEGRDVDDRPVKLSQFRGQVVVLDFWGFW